MECRVGLHTIKRNSDGCPAESMLFKLTMINAAMIELSPGNEDTPVNDNQLLRRCDLEDRRFKFRDVLIFDAVFSVHA